MKRLNFLLILLTFGMISLGHAYPGKIIKTIKAPYSFSTGLTYDGQNLWVADYKADKLVCVNPASGKIVREIPSPGFWPMGLAWDGKYLWNLDAKQNKIFKVDPQDGTIMAAIDAPTSTAEGLTWDGQTLWVSDPRGKEIMKIDLSDGTAVKTFTAPANYAQGLTFDGTYLWCADRLMDEIYMVDPKNGEVIIVTKSAGPYPRGMAWDGKYLWNVDFEKNEIYQLVRQDDDLYRLDNQRDAQITFTHEVKVYGQGELKNLDVYIAVPDNLSQQKIRSVDFVPNNYSTVKDKWNQSFAHFNKKNIPSEANIQSKMIVKAQISDIGYFIFPDRCGTLSDIPADIRKTYTANGSKYLLDDPFIQETAKKLAGSETNPYWIARHVFDYVRNTLEYKLEGGWNVAPVVLERGTGSCSEYTFSFIALCRAAGVPARYVGSIVVRGDDASMDDVFHRWPEVYLPNYGWIPMDPQGGDKPLPRDRAMNIGHLSNRFLITTQGGGDSRYMGWYYNSYETYQADPQLLINIESFGEWEPLGGK
ncbi:MAG: transglutaminase domain-containing protein [Calditrichia bacterium]